MQINTTYTNNQRNFSPDTRPSEEIVAQEKATEIKRLTAPKQNTLHPEITPEHTKNALETFNKIFKPTHLEFQLHQDSGKYFVEIVDDKTKEVLKQIPSEEFLKMIAEAKENHGLIVDVRV